jgi:peptide/nickel transport system permease protein
MTFAAIARRLGLLFLVVWVASTINFFVPRLAPRNPIADKLLAELESGGGSIDIRPMIEAYNAKFGLDKPLIEQYFNYMKDTLSFDLGYSIAYYPTRTADIVLHAMPWTIGLLATTTLLGFLFGTVLGALTVWRGAGAVWCWLVPFMMIFSAIPFYLVGLILIYILAYRLNWFPLSGGMSLSTTGSLSVAMALDIFYHSLLPAFSILVATIGVWALSMRGMMVTVQGEDYMTFAEALGLKNRRRFLQYGVRNAILPQVTQLALSLGHVLSGSILVELVFGYPGVGQQLFRAIQHLDYYVIYGIVFILICTIALAMLLMDLIYPLLDPRVRYARVSR